MQQRFQCRIAQYIGSTGTISILLATDVTCALLPG
jgi:hypothetical protein